MLYIQSGIKPFLRNGRAGKKPVNRELPSNSYVICDTADKCLLQAYVEAVCNDAYDGLVKSGNPPVDVLKAAVAGLVAEFTALCGNRRTHSIHNTLRKVYLYRNYINSLDMARQMLAMGMYDCLENLKGFGIKAKKPHTADELKKLLSGIDARVRSKSIVLKEELHRLEQLTREQEGKKVTVQDYNDQIAAVSSFAGFHIHKATITLAEYAAYVKQFNQSVPHVKNK